MSVFSCWFSLSISSERLRIKFIFILLLHPFPHSHSHYYPPYNQTHQTPRSFFFYGLFFPMGKCRLIVTSGINYNKMAMNTRDERLYHYEYRRPRMHNPTYNSINVFDSLNMFVRTDLPDPLMRSYQRYSLPKDSNYNSNSIYHSDPIYPNRSDLVDSRTRRPLNYSTIQPASESPRRDVLLNGKDYLYLQMIEEKRQQAEKLGRSNVSQNAENPPHGHFGQGDSLTQELKQFQTHKK